ncbi:MAG TPA: orotidine-5'-phosphate decarboxylase [Solibacterales bacterium]|nr:orotidine-5'-phosphate decarboxylase [Bryobacterales bacterium]
MTRNPIIVALDMPTSDDALRLVDTLGDAVEFYKVGLELFTAAGPALPRELCARGKHVFVDLKMFDIGETVKRATAQVAALGARFLTVHSSPQVIRAAKEGARGSGLQILAVTVLTSFDQQDLADLGVERSTADQVDFLAAKGVDANVDGFVCSPLEVARLRSSTPPETVLVTPGVRSAGADKGDQKRVATPAEAIAAGADYLVIGREITRAPDPASAARRILAGLA